jgi:hypothetical protein
MKCADCGRKLLPTEKYDFCKNCLGKALGAYCDPKHPAYDEAFHRQVYLERPDWFEDGVLSMPQFDGENAVKALMFFANKKKHTEGGSFGDSKRTGQQ